MHEGSPGRFISWARKTGPQTEDFIQKLLACRRHPEQSYRACMAVLKLANKHPTQALETACQLAVELDSISYRAVNNLLTTKNDMLEPGERVQSKSYEHIRGQGYYN